MEFDIWYPGYSPFAKHSRWGGRGLSPPHTNTPGVIIFQVLFMGAGVLPLEENRGGDVSYPGYIVIFVKTQALWIMNIKT